jgi:hypothetical protein
LRNVIEGTFGKIKFAHYVARILVSPEASEPRMARPILRCPFQKLASRDDERFPTADTNPFENSFFS